MGLTDVKIKALKPATVRYLLADGNGLNIEVLPSGKLSWIFRYRLKGKPEKVAMGRYPEMTLKRAREERDKRAALVAEGKSPAQTKRLERQRLSAEMTLREFGERYFDEVVTKNRKDPKDIRRYLDKEIYPSLGRK